MLKTPILITVAVLLATSAYAQYSSDQRGDLFVDAGMDPNTRPPVPSDMMRRPDYFAPVPPMANPTAEMFSRAPRFEFVNPDMLQSHPMPVPTYGLYNYPKE